MAIHCISSSSIWERAANRNLGYAGQRLIVDITSAVASAALAVLPGYVVGESLEDPVLSPVAGVLVSVASFVALTAFGRFAAKMCCLRLPSKDHLVRQINEDLDQLTLEQFWNLYKLKTYDFSQPTEAEGLLEALENKFCNEYLEPFALRDLLNSKFFELGGLGQAGRRLELFRSIRKIFDNAVLNGASDSAAQRGLEDRFRIAKENILNPTPNRAAPIRRTASVPIAISKAAQRSVELETPLLEDDEERIIP